MRGRFYALEGLRGTGKSVVSEALAERLGARVMNTVPPEYSALRKHVDAASSVNARFTLYLSAVLLAVEDIELALNSGANVVVESYLLRTLAFHYGMGATLQVQLPQDLLWPDETFYLYCDDQIRRQRLQARQQRETRWDYITEQNVDRIIEHYRRWPMYTIDTSAIKIADVVDCIIEAIKESS